MKTGPVSGNAMLAVASENGGASISGTGGEFSGFVTKELAPEQVSPRDKQRRIEIERVAEVGFAQCAREQHEIKRMIRLMMALADASPADMQQQFRSIIADLENNPPRHPREMYERIEAAIEGISRDAPNQLWQRMQEAYRQLQAQMAKPDEALEILEKAEREKLQRARRYEALVTGTALF